MLPWSAHGPVSQPIKCNVRSPWYGRPTGHGMVGTDHTMAVVWSRAVPCTRARARRRGPCAGALTRSCAKMRAPACAREIGGQA